MLEVEPFFSQELAPCVAENHVRSRSLPRICRSFNRSLRARPGLGIKSGAPASSWGSPKVDGSKPWPSRPSATNRPFVAPATATNVWGYPTSWTRPRGRDARSRFPPLQRAQIVELACLEPVAEGLHITHWTSEDLARQAVTDGIVPAISARTVRRILHDVDLQPHRTRYWRTARLDPQFKQRAEQVLWCYGNADRLAKRGYWVVCADEMPNHQVLERDPIRHSIPGSIEQREFEYTRHGTVNILNFLIVHSGRMEATCLETKDAKHYIEELRRFRRRHHHLRGVYLIHDGDSSHTAGLTREYFRSCHGWWRSRFTPAHASWLDQAEILNNAFGYHYLRRGSWTSRQEFIAHIAASWPEYNERYAHPFEWTWTNQKMRQWFAEHAR
jgi:hypothetical protein